MPNHLLQKFKKWSALSIIQYLQKRNQETTLSSFSMLTSSIATSTHHPFLPYLCFPSLHIHPPPSALFSFTHLASLWCSNARGVAPLPLAFRQPGTEDDASAWADDWRWEQPPFLRANGYHTASEIRNIRDIYIYTLIGTYLHIQSILIYIIYHVDSC